MTSKFLVLFQGRSGSTYLIESLQSNAFIRAEHEKLVLLKDDERKQLEWTKEFFNLSDNLNFAAVGFKSKLTDIVNQDRFAELLRDLEVHIVYLQRLNLVKLVVSWLRSDQLYLSTGQWNLYNEAARQPSIVIECEEFARRLDLVIRGKRQLDQYVSSLKLPLTSISYEDLLLDFHGTFWQLLDFLNVPRVPVKTKVLKHTGDDLRQVIVNFEEIKSRYVETVYEMMFDEVLYAE